MDAIGGIGTWIEHSANLETEIKLMKDHIMTLETQLHTLEIERDMLMEVITKLHLAIRMV